MIDIALITVRSGRGGAGSFSYRREKFAPKGGPDGGDGGHGGDVYFMVNPHKNTLRDFQSSKDFAATDGNPGSKRHRHGENGEDLIIEVPPGTIIWEITNEEEVRAGGTPEKQLFAEMIDPGSKVLIAIGGDGGRGNVNFKSSTNRTPLEYEQGGEPQQKYLLLELKLLADLGFVGFPNAGKSTLLSVLTSAQPKIANYPFTTIDPNLGVMEVAYNRETIRAVLADLPGLVEEASAGKGLGHQFLRHIERCRVLLYVLAPDPVVVLAGEYDGAEGAERLADEMVSQWRTLRQELTTYNAELPTRPFLIGLNKSDVMTPELIEAVSAKLEKATGVTPLVFSAATSAGLDSLRQSIVSILQRNPAPVREAEHIASVEYGPHRRRPRAILARREMAGG